MFRYGKALAKSFLAASVVLALAALAQADLITIQTVWVTNPTTVNSDGSAISGAGTNTSLGAVDYAYAMGKYEVTASQYAAFLNAKAASSDSVRRAF